jgi:hypothetical protein
MNWEAIGAVGEILGAAAVVGTLIYLASQVRYAKNAAADASRLERSSGVRNIILELTRDDELRNTLLQDIGQLSIYEEFGKALDLDASRASKLDYHNNYYFWVHWGQFASSKTDADLDELRNIASTFYRIPAVRHSWENSPNRIQLDPVFVEFIDSQLKKADASDV